MRFSRQLLAPLAAALTSAGTVVSVEVTVSPVTFMETPGIPLLSRQ